MPPPPLAPPPDGTPPDEAFAPLAGAPPARERGRRADRLFYVGGTLVLLVAAGLVVALSAFRHSSVERERQARIRDVDAGPRVRVVPVTRSPGSRGLTLTGEARPFLSVTLYSKVSGYLKNVLVDKGDRVRAGQVLAVVESPETDQEADAAGVDARNKRIIAQRDGELIGRKLIAPEEAEQAETDARLAESRAARFGTLKDYEVLRAPFAGTVTARFADPGALVQNAANAQTGALPVVTVSQTDSLRVYVYLDQRDAGDVRNGAAATITDADRPELHVAARVSRFTGELDPNTRTLLAEIDVDNRRGAIVPNSFVGVSLAVVGHSYLEVPAEALVVRGTKDFVAVVTPANRVTFREVHVADTDGVIVRLLDGVTEGDRVAINLGDSVPEGQRVQPVGDSTVARHV